VPAELLFPWRGFYVDGSVKGEVDFECSNLASGQGRVTVYESGEAVVPGNVTTYQSCPKNVLQVRCLQFHMFAMYRFNTV